MLIRKNDHYATAIALPDGTVTTNICSKSKFTAMLNRNFAAVYDSLAALKSAGWEILPPTWDTLTPGDRVKDTRDGSNTVQAVHGFGDEAVVVMSYRNLAANNLLEWRVTVSLLKSSGCAILPYHPNETVEVMGKKYDAAKLAERVAGLEEAK